MNDPADFYTGLIADLYEPLAGGISASDRFIEFVKTHGEPALELCCGTGLPILDLIEAGLEVEGLDASDDMLNICRQKAREKNLEVTLYRAKMQDFVPTRRYQSAYIANGSITLLASEADLRQTLVNIRNCLEADGTVLIDLDVTDVPALQKYVGRFKETEHEGFKLRVGMTDLDWDDVTQKVVTTLRYERIHPEGSVESIDRPWARTIWNLDQFSQHLRDAGFKILSVDELGGETTQVIAQALTVSRGKDGD